METRKLPVGIESFEEIRTQGFYYVDKTGLIRDLLENRAKVNLFTRPRRFGKTLNMSMLKSFFEVGGDKSLFKGLAISDEKTMCDAHMGKYPVVFISLKNVDGASYEKAYAMISQTIRTEVSRMSFLGESDRIADDDKRAFFRFRKETETQADVYDSLRMMTSLLHKHYGQQVILLIDEYDVPLDKAYQNGYYDQMIDLIRALFGSVLKTNESLYFAVLTGCLRVSKESIFTGLNNLKVHSILDAQFNEYFGFTDVEVGRLMEDYELTAHYDAMREWYDGYRFGKQDVYCPWDVMNYCYDLRVDDDARPQAYWLGTSGNAMVRRLIDRADTGTTQGEIERLIAGEPIRKQLNERLTHNEIDESIENIWSLLFMTGYLTVKSRPEGGIYELVIPNREVRQIYVDQVLSWFKHKTLSEKTALTSLYTAFETGDAATITDMLNKQLIYTISFYDAQESFYHGFLLALLSTNAEWYISSNQETGRGRSDIIAEKRDRTIGLVIEVKDVKDEEKLDAACAAAIRQIEDKDYTATLRKYRYKSIWAYGIAFWNKECRVMAKHVK